MVQTTRRALRGYRVLLAMVILLPLTACAPYLTDGEMADLQSLPQDPAAYLDPVTADQPLISESTQQELVAELLANFFAPWQAAAPLKTTHHPFWAVAWLQNQTVYGVNLKPVSVAEREALITRAASQSYPSLDRRAISLRRCNLRALPTSQPLFNNPDRPGEGFPFDQLQHSALAANTPLHVTHRSTDAAWVFVETAQVYGWLPLTDIAWVDAAFTEAFVTGHYRAVTNERVVVVDTAGRYRFETGIGSLLPATGPEQTDVLVAVANAEHQAQLVTAPLPAGQSAPFPLPATARQIAALAAPLLGQPYDWGGQFGFRDCSATVQDMFAPFGLWLPRNSAKQAEQGRVLLLADQPPVQREQQLLTEGLPFLTLVALPGHIMLYLGEADGRAVLLHTLWGLRTRALLGGEGRWRVGRTVITTLEPGRGQSSFFLSVSSLLDRVTSMNLLIDE